MQSQGDRDVPPFGYIPGYPHYHNGATPPNTMVSEEHKVVFVV